MKNVIRSFEVHTTFGDKPIDRLSIILDLFGEMNPNEQKATVGYLSAITPFDDPNIDCVGNKRCTGCGKFVCKCPKPVAKPQKGQEGWTPPGPCEGCGRYVCNCPKPAEGD